VRNFKNPIVILVFLAAPLLGYAQREKDSLTMAMLVPQQAIKFSPLHLINFYPTVEFSFEQKITSQVTLQAEFGYVLNYSNEWNEDFIDKRGAKIKLEGRYYFFGRTDRKKIYYIAGESYVNLVNFERSRRIRECFDLECEHEFMRDITYTMKYREKGFTIKAGLVWYAGKFMFDFSSGWTVRGIEYREPAGIPTDFSDDWIFFEIPNEDDRIALSPNIGIRLGYRLR
jgi:hypothetical protein